MNVRPAAPLVPPDFVVPDPPDSADFAFEVLGPHHNEADLAAWTGSMEHIQATPGFAGRSWPIRAFTPAENLGDLVTHAEHHRAHLDFAWTVLDPATREVIGCVYVLPDPLGEYDAAARSWVVATRAHLDAVLFRHISEWLAAEWPFTSVRYEPR